MKNRIILILLLVTLAIQASGQRVINGYIYDVETRLPLAYASIGFEGKFVGTVSNSRGEFVLKIPQSLMNSPLSASYLGYDSYRFTVDQFGNGDTLKLTSRSIELQELVIRPLSPTDYIKRAVKQIPINYPSDPFETRAYYREKFVENGYYINLAEGVFKSYYPRYIDTLENQHRLVLFRKGDDMQDLEVMSTWLEKRERKQRKKATKKGEEYEEENVTEEIRKGFGGPETVLSSDISQNLDDCLDSTLFKKFRYQFANGVLYQGRELLVIDFETKGKVDHTRQKGKIYIDVKSDAFAAIEYGGKLVIPAAVKPILFMFGVSISNPTFEKKVRYQLIDGVWYPENFQWFVDFNLKKKYMWNKNEDSHLYAEQVFNVNDIDLEHPAEIDTALQFKEGKPLEEQVYPDQSTRWIEIQVLTTEFEEPVN